MSRFMFQLMIAVRLSMTTNDLTDATTGRASSAPATIMGV
jgi:hypothetical protein